MSHGDVTVRLRGDDTDLQHALRRGETAARSFGTNLMGGFGALSGVMAGVTAAAASLAGVATAGKWAVGLAADAETAATSFRVLLGSTEEAERAIAELREFAAATPFEFPELQAAAKQLLAFGFDAEQLIPTLTTLGDVSSALNIPLGDMAYLYGTTRAQGRLFSQDLMQFTSRGIPMIAALAEQFGVAESEVKRLVEQGRVGFSEVQQALAGLTGEGGQFAGMMAAQAETLAGKWSNLSDTFGQLGLAIGERLTPYVRLATDELQRMTAAAADGVGKSTVLTGDVLDSMTAGQKVTSFDWWARGLADLSQLGGVAIDGLVAAGVTVKSVLTEDFAASEAAWDGVLERFADRTPSERLDEMAAAMSNLGEESRNAADAARTVMDSYSAVGSAMANWQASQAKLYGRTYTADEQGKQATEREGVLAGLLKQRDQLAAMTPREQFGRMAETGMLPEQFEQFGGVIADIERLERENKGKNIIQGLADSLSDLQAKFFAVSDGQRVLFDAQKAGLGPDQLREVERFAQAIDTYDAALDRRRDVERVRDANRSPLEQFQDENERLAGLVGGPDGLTMEDFRKAQQRLAEQHLGQYAQPQQQERFTAAFEEIDQLYTRIASAAASDPAEQTEKHARAIKADVRELVELAKAKEQDAGIGLEFGA